MKIFKKVSAAAAAVVMAAAMAISAAAATADEVVEAAKACGVPSNNVQQLQNYLTKNPDKFTAADYDYMIAAMQDVVSEYKLEELAANMYGKTLGELDDEQLIALAKSLTAEQRQAILDKLVAVGNKYGVDIDVEAAKTGKGFDVYVEDQRLDDNVEQTGLDTSSTTSTATTVAVAGAGAVVLLAGVGVAVIAKKNKEN